MWHEAGKMRRVDEAKVSGPTEPWMLISVVILSASCQWDMTSSVEYSFKRLPDAGSCLEKPQDWRLKDQQCWALNNWSRTFW